MKEFIARLIMILFIIAVIVMFVMSMSAFLEGCKHTVNALAY